MKNDARCETIITGLNKKMRHKNVSGVTKTTNF